MFSSSSEPFKYVPWELSQLDLFEEEEDIEALAELERADLDSSDNDAADDEVSNFKYHNQLF